MQITYNDTEDILMITLDQKKKIEYAEQSANIIVHFSSDHEAVLLEILDAANFLKNTATKLPPKVKADILTS